MQSGIAGEVIRFHVRANSDDEQDQDIKMQVKYAVISYLNPVLKNVKDANEAKKRLLLQMPEIRQTAKEVLQKKNCFYGAKVSLGKEYFPQKTYGDCTFPAGNYTAVIIELGSGHGKNWWCMLYPGLCFIDETYAVVSEEKKEELKHTLTDEEYSWVTDPAHRVNTLRWEWLRSAVQKMKIW